MADSLTPPEQNKRNREAIVRFFRLVGGAVLHPDRLWRQLVTWPVVSFLVAIGIGTGIGVMSVAPPLFLVAKLCFIGSAIILWLKTGHWLVISRATRAERMILAFLIFGVSGMVLIEAVRWISRNQPVDNSAQPHSLMYARFLGGNKNPLGVQKTFKFYNQQVLATLEFEAHFAIRYADTRPRLEIYTKGPLPYGHAAINYAIDHYSEIKKKLADESGFTDLETSPLLTVYPDFVIHRETIVSIADKANQKGILLQLIWDEGNGRKPDEQNPWQP